MAIVTHIAPVPPDFKPKWRDILEKNVAIYRRLPEGLTLRVEELIPWFIEKVQWEWSHWDDRRPEKELHQVCIACEACLLIARRSIDDYAHFRSFIILPDDLTPIKGPDSDAVGDASSYRGQIRQGWKWTVIGMEDGIDNYNVTLHEFAHMIDYRNEPSDSIPYFDTPAVQREYEAFMKNEYADICEAWEKKTGHEVIRKYATTEKSEFFTCATEAYFERAEMLKFNRPELYHWMTIIYQMDPVEWPDRVSLGELQAQRASETAWWLGKHWHNAVLPQWSGSAAEYEHNLRQAELERQRKQKELERRRELERLRREKLRREKLERDKAEKERRERERLERKERERQMLNNRTVMLEHPNGRPHLKYRLVDGRREGLMERWDERGNLRETTEFARGEKHGPVTYYYPGGQKEIEGFFIKNERAGVWRGWHEDGMPSFRTEYREGELHTWEQFSANGESRTYGKVKNRFGR